MLVASSMSNFIFVGARSGVTLVPSRYSTRTVSSVAPASASAAQMIASASSPIRWSVDVTSTNMSLVLVSTLVTLPLIMGGNERTVPAESLSTGYAEAFFEYLPVLDPGLGLGEDLLDAHLPVRPQRDELEASAARPRR